MLRLLGSVLVIGACGTFGIAAWQTIVKNLRAIEAIQQALDYLSAEIQYHRTPVPVLIENLAHSHNIISAQIFNQMAKRLRCEQDKSFSYIWCKTIQDMADKTGLDSETVRLLCDLCAYLGKYDVEAQQKGITYVQQRLKRQQEQLQREVKSRGKLYRTCGLAVGAMVVLLLL